MIAAALLSASTPSSLKSSSTNTTTTTASMRTTEQQVRTVIPVTTSDGNKLFVSGPCIVLKTHIPAPTVAQQMQALRPLLKADINTIKTEDQGMEKKHNDRNNNNNNNNNDTSALNSNASAAPKKTCSANTENELIPLRCKRRIDFTSLGLPRPQPAAMARRNERERNRVKQVNMGFETLRQHVPQGRKNKKLSKVDTLKEAVKYIKYLHQLLMEADQDAEDTSAISDTISMVSCSSPLLTTSSPLVTTTSPLTTTTSPTADTPIRVSSTVTTSSKTTSDATSQALSIATPVDDPSAATDFSGDCTNHMEVSEPADFHVNSSPEFKVDREATDHNPNDLKHLIQLINVQDLPAIQHHQQQHPSAVNTGNTSPCDFLELTPAQVSYSYQDQATSPMDTDPTRVTIPPNGNHPATLHSSLPTAMTFMNFTSSSTSSPDYSPVDVLADRLRPSRQSLRADQDCRGSEGSCPGSPSQSSGASESPGEEYLGVSECETWQDLSADIAEWLCSKIDIDDPDVFV